MAFSVASLCTDETINIHDCANVNTSFPGFVDLARQIGINLQSYD